MMPHHPYQSAQHPHMQHTVPMPGTYPAVSPTAHVPLPVKDESMSAIVQAGIFGLIVGTTGAMGANLHSVQRGDISVNEALSNSMVKGGIAAVATATATAASRSLTQGGAAGLAVSIVTATSTAYLLNKIV